MENTIIVTGGAGFIGNCYIKSVTAQSGPLIVNVDKLTYANNLKALANIPKNRHHFIYNDICDSQSISELLSKYQPRAIVHFAAESHVDRSIDNPLKFVQTNLMGTATLLEATRQYWHRLPSSEQEAFRFHHISTDEVFGSLGETGCFTETTPYAPRSPYSASKAGADHLVRAYHETYNIPTLITNCSNNYGPYQYPEKLIPLTITNAINGKELPIYGDGKNIRDWLYVEDHTDALQIVLAQGRPGETYNIGGNSERTNISIVESICDLVDELQSRSDTRKQIRFVKDRPGHDRRYAVDFTKIKSELGWKPKVNFEDGLRRTVKWYYSILNK